MLSIAISSRALFHIEDGDQIFQEKGQAAFDEYMRSKEDTPLRPGAAFPLIRKLLAINQPDKPPMVEVVMLSRNSPDAGMRIMNSIQHYGLGIQRAIFSKGTDRFRYVKGLGVHLFLSANAGDVKNALDNGIAAATILPAEREDTDSSEVRIAFDGDSVLFSSEGDEVYRAHGLDYFHRHEADNASRPLGDGPFKSVLQELHKIQQQFPPESCPLKVGLVTARAIPTHGRVLNTLRKWGVTVDEAVFANGAPKGPLLRAFGADLFVDDTQHNITSATDCNITSGHVPYGTGHGIVAAA